MMDYIDKEILLIIQNDARIANAEIARRLNMAPSAILERLKKRDGILFSESVQGESY